MSFERLENVSWERRWEERELRERFKRRRFSRPLKNVGRNQGEGVVLKEEF